MKDMREKLVQIKELYQFFKQIGIETYTVFHKKIVSCEESKCIYDTLGFKDDGYGLCKNILVRDKKGKNFWLLIVDYSKKIDLEGLRVMLKSSRLGLATRTDLDMMLKVESGSVSLFSLINDTDKRVKTIVDRDLIFKPCLAFHPNYSGVTSFIKSEDAIKFLDVLGRKYSIMEVPTITKEKEEMIVTRTLASHI